MKSIYEDVAEIRVEPALLGAFSLCEPNFPICVQRLRVPYWLATAPLPDPAGDLDPHDGYLESP